MRRFGREVEVEVTATVDVFDVLGDLEEADLAEMGLVRVGASDADMGRENSLSGRLNALADAVLDGNEARRDELIDKLCWDYIGRMAISQRALQKREGA